MAGKKGIPKSEIKANYINENFYKHVKPHITKRLAGLLETSWNVDAVREMSKEELVTLVTSLSRSANAKISRYKKSAYFQETKEANPDADLRDVKPTPMAYQNLFERHGQGLFETKGLENKRMGELKQTLNTLNHFLSSESSLIGKATMTRDGELSKESFGFKRIMAERESVFRKGVANITGVSSDILQSERFSKLFWEIYNKLEESGKKTNIKYNKEQYMSMISEEIYPFVIKGKWREGDVDDLISKISKKISQLYEEQRFEEIDEDELTITPDEFRTGGKG